MGRWPSPHRCFSQRVLMVAKVSRLFAKYSHGEHFSVSEGWSRSWQTSFCPRVASWWARGGPLNQHQKQACHLRLAVDGPLLTVHLNQPWLGLKSPEIAKFFKWFILKIFCPMHVILIIPSILWVCVHVCVLVYACALPKLFQCLFYVSSYKYRWSVISSHWQYWHV
jgi:hypothetical protein